jgi:hypothetical protein
MPLALVFCFSVGMQLQGLWLGFVIACIILDTGFQMIIMCPSWYKISAKMKAEIEKGRT